MTHLSSEQILCTSRKDPSIARRLADALQSLWNSYSEAQLRGAHRRFLQSLDDRFLKDIGITRAEIDAAVNGMIDSRRGSIGAITSTATLGNALHPHPEIPQSSPRNLHAQLKQTMHG